MELIRLLSDRLLVGIQESRSKSLRQPRRAKLVLVEHREIMKAIIDKNADLASKLMFEHLENVKIQNK